MPEVMLHSVVKYTNEEAYREGENDFDLSMCELEWLIAPVCQRIHQLHFLYNKTYGILILSENMPHVRFTAILNYLSFQEQADSQ